MTASREIDRPRCAWCGTDPLYVAYHDDEWGVPCRDDSKLFEFLLLEGAQAGLSWYTILTRREGYRRAFADFDAERIAAFGEDDASRLTADAGIIRNRLKIASAVNNARRYLELRRELGSFSDYLWSFVGGETIVEKMDEGVLPRAESPESRAMSKDLKKRGFTFVGPTICHAYMQAVGMFDSHYDYCWRRGGA